MDTPGGQIDFKIKGGGDLKFLGLLSQHPQVEDVKAGGRDCLTMQAVPISDLWSYLFYIIIIIIMQLHAVSIRFSTNATLEN